MSPCPESRARLLFAVALRAKGLTARDRSARRSEWQYPVGVRTLAEYCGTGSSLISLIEASGPASMLVAAFDAGFEIRLVPVGSKEEGLRQARRMLRPGTRPRARAPRGPAATPGAPAL